MELRGTLALTVAPSHRLPQGEHQPFGISGMMFHIQYALFTWVDYQTGLLDTSPEPLFELGEGVLLKCSKLLFELKNRKKMITNILLLN